MRKPPLANQASLKLALFLVGVVLVFVMFIMPSLAGEKDVIPIDLQFAYTPDRAYELIDSYSDEVRSSYAIGEMTSDVAYPIAYTLLMSVTLMLLYPRNWKLGWLPYVIFGADMLENTGIVMMLYSYPTKLTTVAWITSGFSTIKWSLVLLVLVIILVGFGKKLFTKNLQT